MQDHLEQRPSIIVFDVNETLLSLTSLRDPFTQALGSADLLGEWFARMLHGSLVANTLDDHRSFATIGIEALKMLAFKHDLELEEGEAIAVVDHMKQLDPHPDVVSAIEELKDMGFRIATLTNSSDDDAVAQLLHAGLIGLLDDSMTVESVGRFKPAAEVYRAAAEHFAVPIADMLMVAAHDWDVAGAAYAGCATAFVTRPGVSWSLPCQPPGIVVADLSALADELRS